MSKSKYKVLHIPVNPKEPYTSSLLDSLRLCGIDAIAGKSINYQLLSLTVLFNIIRYAPVGVIHLHWQHPLFISSRKIPMRIKSLLSLLQLYIAKWTGTKIIWTIHNLYDHENRYNALELRFSIHLAKLVDLFIVHCNDAKRMVIDAYKIDDSDKIVVLPQGNFKGNYTNRIEKGQARKHLGLRSDQFVFLYFGLIRPYKGVLELIAEFRRIKIKGARLIIAGKVIDEAHLQEILKSSALDPRILPKLDYIPDDQIQVYFNASDIVVLPYRNIFNSGCVGLAMTFGKSVIAPRIGCIPEVLESSGNFLYEKSDANGLYQAMADAYTYRDSLVEIEKCNALVSKALDWQMIAENTRRLYEKTV